MTGVTQNVAALLFAIGIGDAFRCYANAFVRVGGMKNFWFSHIYATAAGVLRFTIYVVAILIVMTLSRAFGW